MKTFVVVTLVVLLGCVAIPAQALTLQSASEAVVESVELSLLGGTPGWGVGTYWPLVTSSKTSASLGLFGAFGDEEVGGGLGAKLPVVIPIPVLSELIDFVGGGKAYNWVEKDWDWEVWVGKTITIESFGNSF